MSYVLVSFGFFSAFRVYLLCFLRGVCLGSSGSSLSVLGVFGGVSFLGAVMCVYCDLASFGFLWPFFGGVSFACVGMTDGVGPFCLHLIICLFLLGFSTVFGT